MLYVYICETKEYRSHYRTKIMNKLRIKYQELSIKTQVPSTTNQVPRTKYNVQKN